MNVSGFLAPRVETLWRCVRGVARGARAALVLAPTLTGPETQACAVCHRFRGEGNEVGPDITDVRIKSPEMLLSDILDPNNEVDPRWEAFTIQAEGGRGLVGLIASETNDALVVRSMGGTETLARAVVQQYAPLGASLMPEGLEGILDEPRMADLIAYLRSSHDVK